MKSLAKSFFKQDTLEIAKALLGCYLINNTKEGKVIGRIVETEAYLANDPASHSFKGKTRRNQAMFGPPGRAYVYFTYGMHHCFNVVTAKEGIGEAVLIRALEPVFGIELMKKRRKMENIGTLCDGPAKLVQAMGISKEHNGLDIIKGKLRLRKENKIKEDIITAKRIGLSRGEHLPYRFYLKESSFVSRH